MEFSFPIIRALNRINRIPRIDIYFFKFYSNFYFHLQLGIPKVLLPVGLIPNNSKAYGTKRLFNNPYPEPTQPNSSHTYLFLSNIILPSTPKPS